jgi:hypothetical protein
MKPALLGLRLQDLEDQLLLAHAGRAADGQVLRDLRELLDAHVLQIGDVQPSRLRRRAAPLCGCACGAVAAPCAACGGAAAARLRAAASDPGVAARRRHRRVSLHADHAH